MKVRAIVSFCGEVSMHKGEVRDIPDLPAAQLLKAGYVVVMNPAKPKPARKRKEKKNV